MHAKAPNFDKQFKKFSGRKVQDIDNQKQVNNKEMLHLALSLMDTVIHCNKEGVRKKQFKQILQKAAKTKLRLPENYLKYRLMSIIDNDAPYQEV